MFELDNQDIIKRTIESHVSEIEPLYWVLEDSLFRGHLLRAKAAFHLLLYTAKYRPDLIATGLKPGHRKRMKEICNEMCGYSTKCEIKPTTVKFAGIPKVLPFTKEQELQSFLFLNPDILCTALDDKVMVLGVEVETNDSYRCDIIAESDKVFYPIELKIGQAVAGVVSQIEKYIFYFYRTLRYDRYREIKGVVIANSFDAWSINELRRKGIWIFDIFPDDKNKIKLIKIN